MPPSIMLIIIALVAIAAALRFLTDLPWWLALGPIWLMAAFAIAYVVVPLWVNK